VIHLAIRWTLDAGITIALWGARHPNQLVPVDEVSGWHIDATAKAEIDSISCQKQYPNQSAPNSWRRRHAASRLSP
jgi:diketogulonate reductase-like aldo/keto reductase